eukprot:SAG11_NODE_59_length_19156_cov_11.188750_10_plen_501_part_00
MITPVQMRAVKAPPPRAGRRKEATAFRVRVAMGGVHGGLEGWVSSHSGKGGASLVLEPESTGRVDCRALVVGIFSAELTLAAPPARTPSAPVAGRPRSQQQPGARRRGSGSGKGGRPRKPVAAGGSGGGSVPKLWAEFVTKVYFETQGSKQQLLSCLRCAFASPCQPGGAPVADGEGEADDEAAADETAGNLWTWRRRCERQLGDAEAEDGAAAASRGAVLDAWGLGFALRLLRIDVAPLLLELFFLGSGGAHGGAPLCELARGEGRYSEAEAAPRVDATLLFKHVWGAVEKAGRAIAARGHPALTPRSAPTEASAAVSTAGAAAEDEALVRKARAWLTKHGLGRQTEGILRAFGRANIPSSKCLDTLCRMSKAELAALVASVDRQNELASTIARESAEAADLQRLPSAEVFHRHDADKDERLNQMELCALVQAVWPDQPWFLVRRLTLCPPVPTRPLALHDPLSRWWRRSSWRSAARGWLSVGTSAAIRTPASMNINTS